MATRKEAKKKALLQVLALVTAVVIIVVGVLLFQNWWNSRPGPEPKDVAVTFTVGDKEVTTTPYMACEPGKDCAEADIPTLKVGADETLKVEVPEDVSNHDWQVLRIYDKVEANDETLHGPHETSTVDVPGSVTVGEKKEKAALQVVEVHSVMIGTDANGEETPFTTVWAISTQEQAQGKAAN
ncbi:DUF2771 domain-containing protein [Corynebacterium incognita]|uniref:DUF2771 domain-containing protein n=1 Tax=Corynebacterium incognita TaxID=2754725 RepID=A0A7G7CNI3_9CORY|nr:DUF2771 domain-containing protein [Corynebacterium incognita]QNE89149.1 DUF2771 domain-containing protein [Corynebacterium incognita]